MPQKEKNSLKTDNINDDLSKDIDKVLKGTYNKNDDVKLRDNTPEILVQSGVRNLPILINQRHLRENIISRTKARKLGIYDKTTNYHNLGKETFIKVIKSLDEPLAIMKSISKEGNKNSFVIVTEVTNKNGEQIIIPIYLNGKGTFNNVRIETNKIKTIYGKTNIQDLVDRTMKENIDNIIYLTKDKSKRQIITSLGLQLSNSRIIRL